MAIISATVGKNPLEKMDSLEEMDPLEEMEQPSANKSLKCSTWMQYQKL